MSCEGGDEDEVACLKMMDLIFNSDPFLALKDIIEFLVVMRMYPLTFIKTWREIEPAGINAERTTYLGTAVIPPITSGNLAALIVCNHNACPIPIDLTRYLLNLNGTFFNQTWYRRTPYRFLLPTTIFDFFPKSLSIMNTLFYI
jgi:hypothetical protein